MFRNSIFKIAYLSVVEVYRHLYLLFTLWTKADKSYLYEILNLTLGWEVNSTVIHIFFHAVQF